MDIMLGDSRFIRDAGCMGAALGESTIVMNLESGHYFELGGASDVLWEALEREATVDDLVAAVCGTYEVTEDVARADVQEIVEELVGKGLVLRVGG